MPRTSPTLESVEHVIPAGPEATRLGFVQVRPDARLDHGMILQIRQAVAELDLPPGAIMLLKMHYNSDDQTAEVDLCSNESAPVTFTEVADGDHQINLVVRGVSDDQYASIREVLASFPRLRH